MAPGKTAKMKRVAGASPLPSKLKRIGAAASPVSASKMKRACAASPDHFATALLHILDSASNDSTEEVSPLPAPILPAVAGRKRRCASGGAATKKTTRCAGRCRPSRMSVRRHAATKPAKGKTARQLKFELEEREAAKKRRKGLQVLKVAKIREMARSRGLDFDTKDNMIDGIIAVESKRRDNVRKLRASVKDVIAEKREEFSTKKNKELRDLLQAYALKTSGTKPARVERLLSMWQEQGEIEKVLVGRAFQARKTELHCMSKDVLYDLCRKKGVDALSKDILVERLLVHESVEIWEEVLESRQSK